MLLTAPAPLDRPRRPLGQARLTDLAQAAVLVVLPSGGQRGARRNARAALELVTTRRGRAPGVVRQRSGVT